jgi:hypothetical protein
MSWTVSFLLFVDLSFSAHPERHVNDVSMKYAMVIVKSDDDQEPPSEAQREFESIVRWWADLRDRGKVVAAARLAPPRTAATVSWRDQAPIVTDGPYVEAKETVGGFVVLDVESESEALEIAGSWPNKVGTRIEVRAVLGGPSA